jgi:FixJ family two-component response regulator
MPCRPMIAIIDDDEALRGAIKGLLRSQEFDVEDFGSAAEFLKFDRLHETACLIADVQMPPMSGLDLYRHLVTSGNTIPTILMTAYPNDRIRDLALEAGVICFLTKPFSKNLLLGGIASALNRGKAGGAGENKGA